MMTYALIVSALAWRTVLSLLRGIVTLLALGISTAVLALTVLAVSGLTVTVTVGVRHDVCDTATIAKERE